MKRNKIITVMLVLFSNNLYFYNNKRNYKTNILTFVGARIAAVNLFQVDLDKAWDSLRYCYEKAPPPPLLCIWNAPVMPTLSGVPARNWWWPAYFKQCSKTICRLMIDSFYENIIHIQTSSLSVHYVYLKQSCTEVPQLKTVTFSRNGSE